MSKEHLEQTSDTTTELCSLALCLTKTREMNLLNKKINIVLQISWVCGHAHTHAFNYSHVVEVCMVWHSRLWS